MVEQRRRRQVCVQPVGERAHKGRRRDGVQARRHERRRRLDDRAHDLERDGSDRSEVTYSRHGFVG